MSEDGKAGESDSGLHPHPLPDTIAPSGASNRGHVDRASSQPPSLLRGAKKPVVSVLIAII